MTSHPLGQNHSQVPGLSHQVSGSGVQGQVQVQDPHPYPNLKTRAWIPVSWDLRPEKNAPRYFAYASFAAFWNSRRISLWSEFLRSVRWMRST